MQQVSFEIPQGNNARLSRTFTLRDDGLTVTAETQRRPLFSFPPWGEGGRRPDEGSKRDFEEFQGPLT